MSQKGPPLPQDDFDVFEFGKNWKFDLNWEKFQIRGILNSGISPRKKVSLNYFKTSIYSLHLQL